MDSREPAEIRDNHSHHRRRLRFRDRWSLGEYQSGLSGNEILFSGEPNTPAFLPTLTRVRSVTKITSVRDLRSNYTFPIL